jgi:Spy/CpxP family protein refolding chaperone
MKRTSVIIGLAALFLFFSLMSPAAYGQQDKRPAAGEEWLNLTPEQKTKLGEFRKARQEEMRTFSEQARKLRTELRELMKDPEANENKIDSVIDEMSKLRASQMKGGLRHRLEMKKIFTPEQLEKMQNARPRMGRMGPMRPGRGMMNRPFMRHGFRGWNRGPRWGLGLGLGPGFDFPMARWRWLW